MKRFKYEVVFNESTPLRFAKYFETMAVSEETARNACHECFDELYKNVRGYDSGRLCITELEDAVSDDSDEE